MRAAACSSASRSARTSPARAFSSGARGNSSSATRVAFTWSKRSVYSSTAASPRLRTLSQISVTLPSTSSPNVASNEVSALRRASKSASVVESRAISSMLSRGFRELVEERLDGVAPELERRLVDDEAGADRLDLLDRAQAVGAQRIAAGNQIDDRVGEAHERRELHRAVEPDQIDVHALGCEVLASGLHVLGRHAQTRALAHGTRIIEALGNRDHHAARCDAQVERLVHPLAAVLEQHVFSRDAELRRAVLDVSRNIGRANDEQPQVAAARAQDELARAVGIVEGSNARCGKQRKRFIEDPAFGERERDHGGIGQKKILQQRRRRPRRKSLFFMMFRNSWNGSALGALRSSMNPVDARAELRELLLDALVAAIEVIDPIDCRFALGAQARDDEAR